MKLIGIILLGFGWLIFIQPDLLAYIVASVFMFMGANMLILSMGFGSSKDEPMRFWGYEIYRRKK